MIDLSRIARWLERKRLGAVHALQMPLAYLKLRRNPSPRFTLQWRDRWLCFGDATGMTGFDRHYVFHTAWASRVLSQTRPKEHVDISSSLYFVVNASAFVPMRFYDYRPAQLDLDHLASERADLTALHFASDSVTSLSCMHVVEHVGLGRYGDPVDYEGDLKAVEELKRVVAPGGQLLVVVPIGAHSRIQFNAHRIYTHSQVVAMFAGFDLEEFALVGDDGSPDGLIRHATAQQADGQRYGCGCFHFRKRLS